MLGCRAARHLHAQLPPFKVRLCTSSTKVPPSPPTLTIFGAGLAGGAFGGLVGLGGGVVMVPIMTGIARLTQHQAVGTSSAAVAGTGAAGCISYGSAGAVDLVAAGAVSATALLTARAGAKATSLFNPVQMSRAFAIFQMVVAPMVPLKGLIVKQQKHAGASLAPSPSDHHPSNRTSELLTLAAAGTVAGFASGMFGIGGGVIITPALCLLTEMPFACVLGTTLASMVPPSLVSVATHQQLGNVVGSAVLPLVCGSALGSFVSGQLAIRIPEEPLQWAFAIVIFGQGATKFRALRGKI